MNSFKKEVSKITQYNKTEGTLVDFVKGKAVFIDVSAEGALTRGIICPMACDSNIFALANSNTEMKIASVEAVARLLKDQEIRDDFIIPPPFNTLVVPAAA